MPANQAYFSLFELNQHLKRILTFNMQDPLWIRCEISDISSSKGNWYLSLVERDVEGFKAKSNANIWKKQYRKIQQQLGASLEQILKVGQEVLLQIQVEFNSYYGLSLSILQVDPAFTMGQLELKRIEDLQRLEQNGIILENKKRSMAIVPQRIAVISSAEAAGYKDFVDQLLQNSYAYSYTIELFPSAVQGARVSTEVQAQLRSIAVRKEEFDLIVIVRGGGARLDLVGFDDYDLCCAIAESPLPVLTGIGHEIDQSLADLVAKYTVKTPTAAADFIVEQTLYFEQSLAQRSLEMQQTVQMRLEQYASVLQEKEFNLNWLVEGFLQQEEQKLNNRIETIKLLDPQATFDRGFAYLEGSEDALQQGDKRTLIFKKQRLAIEILGVEDL